MTMQHRSISKKALIALVAGGALLLSLGAWALGPKQHGTSIAVQPVSREAVPSSAFDQGSPDITVPFIQDGTLYLAKVQRPAGGTTTAETSRQMVAQKVFGNVDVNRLTGEYLYQTLATTSSRDYAHTATWLGDATGKVVAVYQGAIESKLSPGGEHIAVRDFEGILRLITREGTEVANYGPAGYPTFSPDGTKLAFLRMVMWGTDDIGGLTVIDLDSGKTIATYDPAGRAYTPLTFSDDGNTLFFTQETPDLRGADLYAMSLPDGNVQLVARGGQQLVSEYPYVQYLPYQDSLMLSDGQNTWIVSITSGDIRELQGVGVVANVDGEGSIARSAHGGWSVISGN